VIRDLQIPVGMVVLVYYREREPVEQYVEGSRMGRAIKRDKEKADNE
jgi:hypothetical protein